MVLDKQQQGIVDDCTGCGVCVAVCPVNAKKPIKQDRGTIVYTIGGDCIRCGRCQLVCPINKDFFTPQPKVFFKAVSKQNVVLKKSSSGGVGYQIASLVLESGGVAYGAAWNLKYQQVEHIRISKIDELPSIQGSKYVQSWISKEIYLSICDDVQHQKVLFTGTPCQVAAVRSLTKNSENLIYIDLICHGVPSAELLEVQLRSITDEPVQDLSFRNGLDFSLRLKTKDRHYCIAGYDNPFYSLYLNFASLRKSCYRCKYACNTRVGDITIGDYVEADIGYSCVVINTKTGNEIVEKARDRIDYEECNIILLEKNHAYNRPTKRHPKTDEFTQLYKKVGLIKAYNKCFMSLIIKRKMKAVIGKKTYDKLKQLIGK